MASLDTNFHIMMVDDDPDESLLFSYAIEALPKSFSFSIQNDGSKVAEVLHNAPPDIVFLDLNMPNKSGYECLKEIRSHREFDNIPVIIYSTSSSKKDVNECFKSGADSYVVKPVSIGAITRMINELCNTNWINAHLTHQHQDFVLKFE